MPPPRLSQRGQVSPFLVMDIVARANALAASGRSIIHLEVGQPGTAAPAGARAALAAALSTSPLGYTEALGLPALRKGIAALYKTRYGLDISPERVVITAGSSAAFILAFTALFDAGDAVALGEPGYPSYRQILSALSLAPVGMQTAAAARFQPTPSDLAAAAAGVGGDKLRGLIVASPCNPAGTMLGAEALGALVRAAEGRGWAVISDEIYHGLSYAGERDVCALEVSDSCYVVSSFSKYFSMTGYRVGWMVVPEAHVRTIERLAQNLFICPPHASQVAALAALGCGEELEANKAVYAENRRLMLEKLPGCGFPRFAPPDGAFYVLAEVGGALAGAGGAVALCEEMLREAGVAVTPGLDFDPVRGQGTVRFSYARSTADVEEGLRRLTQWFAARGGEVGGPGGAGAKA